MNISEMKVLFVDDEINILKSLRRELAQVEFKVLIANSGPEGLKILESEDVDIVVSDVKMPEMDGMQFLNIVKEKYPHINRIILSGFVERTSVIASIVKGIATTYFAKPWDIDILRQSIEHILKIKILLQQRELLSVVNSIDKLPTLPELYREFLNAIAEEKSVKDIAKIIYQDVTLTTRILQVANSVFCGVMKTSSIERAIIQLGLTAIKDITLTVSLVSKMNWTKKQSNHLQKIFLHSTLVNYVIKEWAQKTVNPQFNDQYSSVGMTHDIGKIIFLQYLPERYDKIIHCLNSKSAKTFYQCEKELGFENITHAEIGAYFISLWNLPDPHVEVAMFHHDIEKSSVKLRELVLLTANANSFINQITLDIENNCLDSKSFNVDFLTNKELETLLENVRSKIDEWKN